MITRRNILGLLAAAPLFNVVAKLFNREPKTIPELPELNRAINTESPEVDRGCISPNTDTVLIEQLSTGRLQFSIAGDVKLALVRD